MGGWIAVDLDGTLAKYDGWKGANFIGDPIPLMQERVKEWIAEGKEVRIFTARAGEWLGENGEVQRDESSLKAIKEWCIKHLGQELPITCKKDYAMVEIWDDRAIQVIPNTGKRADGRD